MIEDKRQVPKPGEKFKHFKNKLYQIVGVATHSETKEPLVIYQALYGEFGLYARPLDMFMSEVDHEKYPDVAQKYRFERVDSEVKVKIEETVPKIKADIVVEGEVVSTGENDYASLALAGKNEDGVDPALLAFLDADSFKEKYAILKVISDRVDDGLIDSLAASIDVVIEEGPIQKRMDQLKQCVRVRQKYESTRFFRD